ncbi:MAG: peroxiredoxin [Culturomica sp.]|jgi:peroxiredoxin (alkyl hydroperoxide reductase subunit C)|nr:peroxiredoxin [Culturomica sp.]
MEEQINVMPRIGEPAPAFEASTTQGKINFPADFKGKWTILFSHPSDFTPVCTSEFMTFGTMAQQFEDLGCRLLGLSVDGLSSHIAWLRTIKDKIEYRGMKHVDVEFPLIDDLTMKIAKLYGMIHPGASSTAAVRAVFFIDPKGIIRTILYYPMALGRNFDEIKRILIGLQTVDNFGVALPADWRPGNEVIVPTASSMKMAADRMAGKEGAMKCYDWFFCTKELSREEVEKKLGGK